MWPHIESMVREFTNVRRKRGAKVILFALCTDRLG